MVRRSDASGWCERRDSNPPFDEAIREAGAAICGRKGVRGALVGRLSFRVPRKTSLVSSPLRQGVGQVLLGRDVVAVENCPRPVPRDLHRDPFGNARPDHVPHRRAAEIVDRKVRELRPLLRPPPCRVEVADFLAPAVVEDQRTIERLRLAPSTLPAQRRGRGRSWRRWRGASGSSSGGRSLTTQATESRPGASPSRRRRLQRPSAPETAARKDETLHG